MTSPPHPPVTDELIPAATVILGRDTPKGIEVLMLRRNSTIAFGGAWVFPGGRVDDVDEGHDVISRARSAAVRESEEETGLDISDQPMGVWSYWAPPAIEQMVVSGKRRRFATWFLVAEAPDAEVAVDMGEIHEHRWLRPLDAIALHRTGEIELIPPTWITLTQLSKFSTIGAAVQSTTDTDPPQFVTQATPGPPVLLVWEGDVAYGSPEDRDAEGPRHRLTVSEDRDWTYERT